MNVKNRFNKLMAQVVRALFKLCQFQDAIEEWRDLKTKKLYLASHNDRGDVPGWVLVVLMTTGLITGIWTVAAPRLSAILTHSLDSMNNIR